METENKDWKPEVGKTAWTVRTEDGSFSSEVYEVVVKFLDRHSEDFVWCLSHGWGTSSYRKASLFPTPEAALASIKIYDLEGKEVLIPRASVENSESPTKLSKEREMQLLNLAIAYGDADYQQKDGADRAWHHVATAREKLIAFVENREPELDDEY